MTWLLVVAGLAALVVLHEFGHFIVAKAVGMRVEKFSLFFGPMFWSFRRGETVYGIGVIPLGGYVRISGMNPHEELPPEVQPRAYYRQAPWKRIVVILAGPAMNVLVAFVILLCLFGFQGAATPTHSVDTVQGNAPAGMVLRPGDRITAIDGVQGSPLRLRAQIATHRCPGAQVDGCRATTPVHLTVVRAGRTVQLEATPRYSASAKRPLLGFAFGLNYKGEGIGTAAGDAVSSMWRVTKGTVSAVAQIFVSSKARNQIHGIVGVSDVAHSAFGFSAADAFNVLAIISLSLAIVNMFPFLPLDGGHVFWAVAEKVRGRAIPFSVMERAGVVGFVLIVMLFLIGLSNDITTLRGKGFGVH